VDEPAPGTLYLTTGRFRLNDSTFSNAERGYLFVPMDRSDSNSPTISVEVFRFPATTEAGAERPPIFRLFGGPASKASRSMTSKKAISTQVPLRPSEKLPMWSSWAGGASACLARTRGVRGPSAGPDSLLTTEQVQDRRQSASRTCKQFWEQQGLALEGLNVLEAAADVNAVCEAFGYESIMLRGGSFGSHWSMAVLHRYPGTVELDRDAYATEPFDYSSLQLGIGSSGEHTFDLPEGHPDADEDIAAYYFWLFPNLMLRSCLADCLWPATSRISCRTGSALAR